MATLYELTDELLALQTAFEERGGEISDQELDAYLKLEQDLVAKVDQTIAFARELEARAKARREEASRLLQLAQSDEALAARLKQRVLYALETVGRDRLETPRFRLTVRLAGGKQGVLLNVKPEELPSRFQRVVISPDFNAIREALEAGDPEAQAVAELQPRRRVLYVR